MVEWVRMGNYVLSTGMQTITQSIPVMYCGVWECIEQSFSKFQQLQRSSVLTSVSITCRFIGMLSNKTYVMIIVRVTLSCISLPSCQVKQDPYVDVYHVYETEMGQYTAVKAHVWSFILFVIFVIINMFIIFYLYTYFTSLGEQDEANINTSGWLTLVDSNLFTSTCESLALPMCYRH